MENLRKKIIFLCVRKHKAMNIKDEKFSFMWPFHFHAIEKHVAVYAYYIRTEWSSKSKKKFKGKKNLFLVSFASTQTSFLFCVLLFAKDEESRMVWEKVSKAATCWKICFCKCEKGLLENFLVFCWWTLNKLCHSCLKIHILLENPSSNFK